MDVDDKWEISYQFYALVREGVLDTPGHEGTFESYDTFMERIYEPCYLRHAETQYLAAKEGALIALSSIQIVGTEGRWGLTTVQRPYRRLGIAGALKKWALHDCRSRGLTRLIAQVNQKNFPMYNLNKSLGFRPLKETEGTR